MEHTTAEDDLWDILFSDPRSEDILLALANEAREVDESEVWSLEDSGL